MKNKISPRQELGRFASGGDLRSVLERNPNGLSYEAISLLVDIAVRYCEPRRRRRKINLK